MQVTGNNAQLSKNVLSIHFSVDGFSFSTDRVTKFPIDPACTIPANINRMLETNPELLSFAGKRTNIIVDTPHFTFVPFELYEDEQLDAFFQLNYPTVENEEVLCNVLDRTNVALVFGVNREVLSLLGQSFPNARILSALSPMTEWLIGESNKSDSTRMSVLIHADSMDVFVCSKGKLLFVNSFICNNNNDRCYFALQVWQSLQLDEEKDSMELYVSANVDVLPTEQLRRFVRQVNVTKEISGMTFPLKTLYLCE